ncbi:MAG: tetratricopeptide repeat protein, partial [Bacteroidia bacterium]
MKQFYSIFFFSLALISCGDRQKDNRKDLKQLNLSADVGELLKDTSKFNPIVDSLRQRFSQLNDTLQINLLNELSENWRPFSKPLADEALLQSKKINYEAGEADAYCKLGINYYRHSGFDSASYFLDKAQELADRKGYKQISAQALSWKGELMRIIGENEKAKELVNKALYLATNISDKKRMAFCLNSKAELTRMIGDFKEALNFYEQSINYAQQVNDIYRITICYSSIGDIYKIQNDYPRALEYFNKALALAKKNNDGFRIAFCLSTMGDIYSTQREFDKALDYYTQSLKISKEIDYKLQVGKCESNIGQVYHLQNKNAEALEWFDKAIKSAEGIGNRNVVAFSMMNMGEVYLSRKEYRSALEKYKEVYEIEKEIGNKNEIAGCLSGMGECYFAMKNYAEAKKIAKLSLEASRETEIPDQIKNSAWLLYEISETSNNYADALEMLKLFMEMKDISGNENQVKKFAAVEFKAKEDKLIAEQAAKEKVFRAEEARKEEELKRQKTIRYAFTIGFGLVLILAVVIFRSLQQNKKQNKIIIAQKKEVEHQKELVDEKNKEITDSITYAKRLQDAILPPLGLVRQYIPDSFVLYKPKDIIAGDFYWMEFFTEDSEAGSSILIAAADCTGHGVPGAMVSVVCSNALNRAVKEFQITDPGMILTKVRDLVLETFEKSESEVKDGMDISLAAISHAPGSKHTTVKWAGANNPLWYLSDGVVHEIKADKQPIGKSDNPKPFTTHTIELKKGDSFYLFTDGYADQFGGDKGKKFKYKQLQDKILALSQLPVEEQKEDLL